MSSKSIIGKAKQVISEVITGAASGAVEGAIKGAVEATAEETGVKVTPPAAAQPKKNTKTKK